MLNDPILLNDWHPVASLDQLATRPIIPVRLLGVDLVVWQVDGRPHVWRDLCIHRGAQISGGSIENGCLACPYHGWRYDENGRCVHIPAHPEQTPPTKAQTITYQSRVAYGLVWACLGEPANDLPSFPEWGVEGFATAVCGPFPHVKANGPRLIENFLDAAHFPFVHGGVLGVPSRAEMSDYEARITENGVETDPIEVYQPDPYGSSAGKVTYTYHAFRPLTGHFTKHAPGTTNGLLLTITQHDEMDSTAWFVVATTSMSDNDELREVYTPRIGDIFEEDRVIVESQRPELLPLDLQAELHLKSDRVAIAYRRWLNELGLTFGTQ